MCFDAPSDRQMHHVYLLRIRAHPNSTLQAKTIFEDGLES
jgi:hypothetical protein